MVRSFSAVALMVVAGAISLAAPAQAARSAKPPPNPCKTFTVKSADKLFGISKHKHPKEKQTTQAPGTPTEARLCTVTAGKKQLIVTTQRETGGSGGPEKCYKKPKLGPNGEVCESDNSQYKFTGANFTRHGAIFSDYLNVTLPHKGKKMYVFALAQYRAFKG